MRYVIEQAGPESGAAVMATGIVSVVLRSAGHPTASRVLFGIAAATWVVLAAVFAGRLLLVRERWRREAGLPASLTAVAATAVLGVRVVLFGSSAAGWALLALAVALYVTLIGRALRALSGRAHGATFLLVVATEALAVLAGELALVQRHEWLALVALGTFLLGLGLYVAVLRRYRLRALRAEAGDHWITGGALAISTLACGQLGEASNAISALHGAHGALRDCTLVLWALTIAWLPVLVACEIRWPRVRYDVRRWATVFPLGMYAAMSFTAAGVAGATWIGDFARAWSWVALAAWIVVALGAVGRLRSILASA